MKLLDELKRRKVFRVAAVYAVVAWLLIQVADVVLPTFGAPGWVNQTLIFLFVIGFPVAVVLAWAYEVTPEGVRADSGVAGGGSQVAPGLGLIYATFALVLLMAGFQIADRFLVTPASPIANTTDIPESGISTPRDDAVMRASIHIPEAEFFHYTRGDFDLAPDGSFFVYLGSNEAGDSQLWLRRWDSLTGQPLPGTSPASRPEISPDGREVLFPSRGAVQVLTLSTGAIRTLIQRNTNVTNLVPDWSRDGNWVYFINANGGISRVPAVGGAEEVVIELNPDNGDGAFSFFEPLPGSGLLFTVVRSDGISVIRARDGDSGQVKDLAEGNYPIYSATGHLLFQRPEAAQLLAAPFDPEAMELLGPPQEIDSSLLLVGGALVGNVGVSNNGRLLYRKGNSPGALVTPVWVERDGSVTEVESDWQMVSVGGHGIAALSPTDDAIAVAIGRSGPIADIWVNQLDGPMTRITFGDQQLNLPNWSADGEHVYYQSNDANGWSIRSRRADGSGQPQTVFENDAEIRGFDVSRDGRWIIFRDMSVEFSGRLRALDLEGDGDVIDLVADGNESSSPALSPDGRWLAYVSDESDEYEIYVRPFPEVDAGRWQISVNGGTEPVWGNSGRELFYRNGDDDLVVIEVAAGDAFQWQEERVLFDATPFREGQGQVTTFSIASDDQRFLMMRRGQALDTELILVDNWHLELEGQ